MSIIEGEPQAAPASVSLEIGGKEITFETGKLAKQADGAVVVRSGDTMVLATAQGRTEGREGADFFPLTIDVEERMYAAGKIPGGFFKREGRPTERAILTARMIDRPIRPLWPKGYRNEVQCIATVLSADLITSHDILAINGVSAALMISPMPFLGPIGAVRIGLDRRRARRQPDAPRDGGERRARPDRRRHEGRPDDGRGRRGPGARGAAARGARPRAAGDREALRGAGAAPRTRPASRSGSTPASPRRSTTATARRSSTACASTACTRAPRSSARSSSARPAGSRWSRPRTTSSASSRCGCRSPRCSRRSAPRSSRARSASSSRTTCAALTEAEQDSKELKSAKQHLLYERIVDDVHLPFPVGPDTAGEAVVKDSLTKHYVKKAAEAIYKDLVRKKIAVDKRRPDGRSETEIRPITCEVDGQPAHARLGPLHPRPDADHVAAHARHRQGGPADRRPLAREGPPLHAPLQLPAVLGRGDGPHDRPAPPRHRPRRARPAGARGESSRTRRTSRTRSASSPRRSSRTARRRWARSAARRSR